jgi:hypothetical protein
MTPSAPLLLDSDVFIAAKNAYYAFDICPGFWKGILRAHAGSRARSLDRIRAELLTGRRDEDLVLWVRGDLPEDFFLDSNATEVSNAYAEVMLWVQRNPQYFDRAKAKFATEADGWLVAYSMVNGNRIVTNEQPRPDSRNRVLLPDVCEHFGIAYEGTFQMLRELSIHLDLAHAAGRA